MRTRWSALGLLLLSFLLAPEALAQQSAQAQALYVDGRLLQRQGKYDQALLKLKDSQALDPGSGTLIAIGECYESMGQTASAWGAFKDAAVMARQQNNKALENKANTSANNVETKLSKLRVNVDSANQSPGFEVRRNGERLGPGTWGSAIPVDPGNYTLEATAPGKQAWTKQVTIAPTPGTTDATIPPLANAPPPPAPVAPAPAPPAPVAPTPAPPKPVVPAEPPPWNVQRSGNGPPPGYGVPPGAQPPPLGPPTIDYEKGMTIPPNYRLEKRTHPGLLIGGVLTFGNSYLLSVIAAGIDRSIESSSDAWPLYIPLAGPFITIDTDATPAWTFALVVDGVAQTGGLALGIAGLAWKEVLLVRKDISARSFMITPMVVGRGTMGVGIVGSM